MLVVMLLDPIMLVVLLSDVYFTESRRVSTLLHIQH